MTRFQQLLNKIELLKQDKRNLSKKWAPYVIQPVQDLIDIAIEFSKNFTNKDGSICETSLALLLLEIRELERRIEELETETRELRYMQE